MSPEIAASSKTYHFNELLTEELNRLELMVYLEHSETFKTLCELIQENLVDAYEYGLTDGYEEGWSEGYTEGLVG